MMHDLVVTGGPVATMDESLPQADWVAITHGVVTAVGVGEPPAAREVLNAEGGLILPGFNDAHCHTMWFGLSLAEVDCKSQGTLDAVYDALVERAREVGPGAWVLATGYNQEAFDGHYPDIQILDRLLPENPLFLRHTSGHACIVNTAALKIAGLDGDTAPDIPGGVIVRDAHGTPTGVLEERAQSVIQELLLPKSQSEMVAALDRATAVYATEGITSFTETGIAGGWIGHSPLEFSAYQTAREAGVLRARAQLMPVSDVLHPISGHAEDPHRRGLDAGIRTGVGDDYLSLGGIKIFLDGSMLAWTGAMSEPFAAGPADNYGYFQAEISDLHETMLEACASGWSIGAHAIGDRAVALALDTFDEAISRYGAPTIPHRIEHGGVVTDEQARRAAQLGVAIVTQPGFMPELGVQMSEAMGPERTPLIHRHQGLLDAGVMVAGSSDRPVATGRPLSIIQSMVERLAADGSVVGPQERVSIKDALWSYTLGSAQTTGMAHRKGQLRPGFLGDVVVLSGDPLRCPTDEIAGLDVVHTIVGGHFTLKDGEVHQLPHR
jgi:predicted amidohydrolase YtcJ